ncbi:MAG: Non-ribosomal peptide synthetase -like protein [Actinomycetia bacterium]|nr:Non-ribosomal peptide synthetase -like protein [Actinomycetes bacterium]
MTVPARAADTAQLSWNQEFLCSLYHGETAGSFSQWYTVTYGLRITGEVDEAILRSALDDVVARHEVLRSSLVRDGERWRQEVHPSAPVSLLVRDEPDIPLASRDARAHELLNEAEGRPFSTGEIPLLRSVLVRFGPDDALLILTTHHIASDAWSMQVIIRDLTACYSARRGGRPHGLPDPCQYRDFARWQRADGDAAAAPARQYWRENLPGARILALPADRVLPAGAPDPYSVHRFMIDAQLSGATAALARSTRSSSFIVLLAAYNLLACQLTGATDLTVPIFTSGRAENRVRDSVGPFYNFLPIRTDLAGCASFLDVLARTRASCLNAYAHDIPFALIAAEAGDLMGPCREENLEVAAFEMMPPGPPGPERAGDITYAEIRDRTSSQPVGSTTPRGMLWALDQLRSGEIVGSVRFSRHRFQEGTIPALVAEYRRVLATSVAGPATRLDWPAS